MEKYISLNALVAEIRNKVDSYKGDGIISISVLKQHCEDFIDSLNTFEVKEIDLEDSKKEELAQKYIDYTFKRHNIDENSKEGMLIYYAYMHGMNQCLTQLRKQKEE